MVSSGLLTVQIEIQDEGVQTTERERENPYRDMGKPRICSRIFIVPNPFSNIKHLARTATSSPVMGTHESLAVRRVRHRSIAGPQ